MNLDASAQHCVTGSSREHVARDKLVDVDGEESDIRPRLERLLG
jgi:hypothetical protein